MRLRRQLDADRIAGLHLAAGQRPLAITPALRTSVALLVALERRGHQPRLDPVQLLARVAQAGHLDHRLARRGAAARPAGRPSRSTPRVVTFSPICPAPTSKPGGPQLVVQLGVDQVHLAQVGLLGVARDPRAVLDRRCPECTSPSTPTPATRRMRGWFCLGRAVRGAAAYRRDNGASPTGDGGQDRDLVAVADRRVEAAARSGCPRRRRRRSRTGAARRSR